MALAPLNFLLRKGAMIFERPLPSPDIQGCAEPFVFFLIHADLALPLGVQQILPVGGRLFRAYQPAVVAEDVIVIVHARPVALGIFERIQIRRVLRRAIRLQQSGFLQWIDHRVVDHVDDVSPRPDLR